MKILITERQLNLLTEAAPPFLTAFPNARDLFPRNAKFTPPITARDNTSVIFLTKRDQNGNPLPNTKFSYKVSGSYGLVNFDIVLRKVERSVTTGALTAEVMPTNGFVKGTMKTLVPEDAVTPDGWLTVYVSTQKINDALIKLHNNKGAIAKINLDKGININIQKVG